MANTENNVMIKKKIFYYGVQYFRPPNPPRAQHKFHLTKIKKELGFNVVKLFCQWNACHRSLGLFDFSEYEEIMSICNELGLNVIVNTALEDAPYWLEQTHPECRYVNSKGRPDVLSGNDNHPSGGHPGLCLDNPTVLTEGEKFLTSAAQTFKKHPSLLGYDCWNEPHIEPCWDTIYWADAGDLLYCYCPGSIRKFRAWLKKKYGEIKILNSAWVRYYSSWEEVNPPRRHGNFADWLDWFRFWFENLREQMKWRYETLKKIDPDHFIMSHSGGVPPILPRIEAGINNFELAKEVDIWGTSLAPLYQNWTTAETAAALELTRSAAKGKEYWVSEMQAGYGQTIGLHKTPRPEPRHIRTWNWLSVVYGAKGIMYWCYLTEITGNEAQGYGLIRFNGETTDRAREASCNFQLMQRYKEIFLNRVPVSDVAILYDPMSSVILFAQEGNDKWISQSHIAYYRIIWDSDLYARWVTFEDLKSVTEKVLIVPMHYIITEEAATALRQYVENGGTLIAENSFGLYTPNGMLQPQVPPYGLAEIFGLSEEENFFTWPGYQSSFNQPFIGSYNMEIHASPEIKISHPIKTQFPAYGFLTPLRLTTAKSLGGWKDYCLAAYNRFGKGDVYYFGTFLGLSIFHKQSGAGKLIAHILAEKVQPKVSGKNLRPRLVENGKEGLLIIFNNSRFETHTESIMVPKKYKKAVDIHKNKKIPLTNGYVQVAVPAEDVCVLHLS